MDEEVVMDPLASYDNEQVIIVFNGRLLLLYIPRTLILHLFKGLQDRYSFDKNTKGRLHTKYEPDPVQTSRVCILSNYVGQFYYLDFFCGS